MTGSMKGEQDKVSDCSKIGDASKTSSRYGESSAKNSESSSSNSSSTAVSDSNDSGVNTNIISNNNNSSSSSNKPHKANDKRWEAMQAARAREGGELGLSHFRLLKRLGCGDIGSVYLAELRGSGGCYFAMKVMDKGSLLSRKKVLRAQTEKEILALLDHPFLPTLYAHFETDKFSCLVMEFCTGGDLHTLRQRQPGKHFSEQAARFYASQVLLAIEYLHMLGIVYRDLKPENVLVREDGHIMLSDFDLSLRCVVSPTLVRSTAAPPESGGDIRRIPVGCVQPAAAVAACAQPACFLPRLLLSRKHHPHRRGGGGGNGEMGCQVSPLPELVAEPTGARSMSFVGTHEYLAPEIIKGEGHGSAVDWWTFGIFLYELLHGKTPFKGAGNRATLFNVVGQPLRFPEGSGCGHAARDLVRGLLAKEPQQRLGSRRGATEIKQHPFFDGVNWALIRSNLPPEVPKPFEPPPELMCNNNKKNSNNNDNKPTMVTTAAAAAAVKDHHQNGGGSADLNDGSSSGGGGYLDFDFF